MQCSRTRKLAVFVIFAFNSLACRHVICKHHCLAHCYLSIPLCMFVELLDMNVAVRPTQLSHAVSSNSSTVPVFAQNSAQSVLSQQPAYVPVHMAPHPYTLSIQQPSLSMESYVYGLQTSAHGLLPTIICSDSAPAVCTQSSSSLNVHLASNSPHYAAATGPLSHAPVNQTVVNPRHSTAELLASVSPAKLKNYTAMYRHTPEYANVAVCQSTDYVALSTAAPLKSHACGVMSTPSNAALPATHTTGNITQMQTR